MHIMQANLIYPLIIEKIRLVIEEKRKVAATNNIAQNKIAVQN